MAYAYGQLDYALISTLRNRFSTKIHRYRNINCHIISMYNLKGYIVFVVTWAQNLNNVIQ